MPSRNAQHQGAGAGQHDAARALGIPPAAHLLRITLPQALRTVRTHLVRVRRLARYRPDRLAASVAEHRAIASAIADGDADLAAAATHLHLHASLRSILDALGDAAVNVDDISTERTPA